MKDYSGCDLSLFDSLCAELGPEVVFERYFDENYNVREDAPTELKNEIEALRASDDCPPPPPGVVWR